MTYFWQNPVTALNRQSNPLEPNAKWSTQYIDRLPDSAFLIVDKSKVEYKEGGRSHPLSSRALPVKNHLGQYDCSHLKNAEARANQVDASVKVQKAAKKKASNLYDKLCAC